MREILFKAKAANREEGREYRTNYKNGDWVYGLVTSLDNYYLPNIAEMKNTDGVSWIEVEKETICQWTGLVDANGVKIFEWDILKPSFDEKWKCLVQFKEGAFGVKYMATYLTFCDFYGTDAMFEVIGNIFDKAVEE